MCVQGIFCGCWKLFEYHWKGCRLVYAAFCTLTVNFFVQIEWECKTLIILRRLSGFWFEFQLKPFLWFENHWRAWIRKASHSQARNLIFDSFKKKFISTKQKVRKTFFLHTVWSNAQSHWVKLVQTNRQILCVWPNFQMFN